MARQAIDIQMDSSQLSGALRQLARLSGKDFSTVVDSEASAVLKSASKSTEAAKPSRANELYKKGTPKQIAENKKNYLLRMKLSRGLLKKGFVQLGESLGINVDAPKYVKSATTKKGDYPQNARGNRRGQGNGYFLDFTLTRVYGVGSILGALRGALNGRAKFFENNLRKGVFNKMETIAAKYKGLNISK